jgi:hypothetical protein
MELHKQKANFESHTTVAVRSYPTIRVETSRLQSIAVFASASGSVSEIRRGVGLYICDKSGISWSIIHLSDSAWFVEDNFYLVPCFKGFVGEERL